MFSRLFSSMRKKSPAQAGKEAAIAAYCGTERDGWNKGGKRHGSYVAGERQRHCVAPSGYSHVL